MSSDQLKAHVWPPVVTSIAASAALFGLSYWFSPTMTAAHRMFDVGFFGVGLWAYLALVVPRLSQRRRSG